jgi:hypothetical protein
MPAVEIRRGYVPGCIGRVAELNATYYHEKQRFELDLGLWG